MSAFLRDLMQSIFTPGPTDTLIVATNASFACLQVLLLLLLIATYSIHFLILSCLCGGLWWAVNWFVSELRTGQATDAEKVKQQRAKDVAAREDSETEAETVIETGDEVRRSKDVELHPSTSELHERGSRSGNKSEASTEDEWERVSENEKDK